MYAHDDIAGKVRPLIRNGQVKLAGNAPLKIYGLLSCRSGKRMKQKNRVFFTSTQEAIRQGYRPCGHCMKEAYQAWKKRKKQVEQES